MSLGTLNVMLIADSTPSCRVFDIAQALAITVGGASQAVDRLERSGWCIRKPHPSDRRSSIVELTPAAKQMLAKAGPIFDDELQRLLRAPLAERDLGQLAESLHLLRRAVGDGVGSAASASPSLGISAGFSLTECARAGRR